MPNRARTVVAPIAPFVGLIETTQDALLIFEAARRAVIPRITRRLLESEKVLIKSGAVFVFDELESGIKRWTDGLVWSPSRILSNFIIYREANERTDRHPPRPRSKKGHQAVTPHVSHRASSSSSSHVKIVYPDELNADGSDLEDIVAISEEEEVVGKKVRILRGPRPRRKTKAQTEAAGGIATQEDRERELVGSLTTSSKYKTQGLIKKTISVHINGIAQHLVSYYNMEDALSGKLRTPSSFPELAELSIHPDLLANDQFRYAPKTEIDSAGTLRYLGESDEAAVSTSPPARKLAPPPAVVRERRVLSAEPAVLVPTPAPVSNLLTSPVPHKRRRSTTISTLDDVPPVVLVIQDGRPLAAETLRLNPPADIVLSSTLLKGGSHQLYPTLSQDQGGPSVFVSRPETRRTDFESEEEHDASISGALTPSSLQRTMASLASYELNGEHHGWKTGEGLENERLDRKRKWTESNQSSPEWEGNAYQHQAPSDSLLTAQYPPLRPSYDSSTSLENFIHSSHLTPSSFRTNLPNPDFPFAPTPNPNESLSPSSASSSSNSSSLPFSRFNRPTFRTHSRQPSYQPPSPPPKVPDRPHPQSSSYFPFNNQHLQLTKSLSLPPQHHQQQQHQHHPRPSSSSRTTSMFNIDQCGSVMEEFGLEEGERMGQAEFKRRKEENQREEEAMMMLVESSPGNYGGGWPGVES